MISPLTLPRHARAGVPRRRILGGLLALPAVGLVGGALAGCRGETEEPTGEPAEVTVLSSFGTLGRDAYLWVAQAKGFFTEAGITVTIQPGTGAGTNITQMSGGAAQFSVMDIMGALVTHGNQLADGGARIRLLGAVQQRTIAAIMSVDPTITDPADLAGRRLGLTPGSATDLLFQPWAGQLPGLEPDRVEVVSLDGQSLPAALAEGQVDAIGQFVVGEPLIRSVTGTQPTIFPYGDSLADAFGVGIFTTYEMAEQHPDLCVRFRDAVLRGLEYALANPEEAGQILHDAVAETNPEVAAEEVRLMEPYTHTPAGTRLGTVDLPQVARAIGLLEATGAVPAGISPEDLVDPNLILAGAA